MPVLLLLLLKFHNTEPQVGQSGRGHRSKSSFIQFQGAPAQLSFPFNLNSSSTGSLQGHGLAPWVAYAYCYKGLPFPSSALAREGERVEKSY